MQRRPARRVSRVQPLQGELRVGPHPLHAVAAQGGVEQGQRSLHHPAFRGRRRRRRAVGRGRPALDSRRLAQQRVPPGPSDGDQRVAFDQPLFLEPVVPADRGVAPPARIGPCRRVRDQPGDPVGVPGGPGMVDGDLRQAIGLTPGGRPDVQPRHQPGLASLELGPQQLAEQAVVAVPGTAAVQRDHQQVRVLQRLQDPARPLGVEDRVAQRPRHPLQHRGAGQEDHLLRRELGQQLRAQVVGDEPVVPGERGPAVPAGAAGLAGQRGQVQPHRPPFGLIDQLRHVRVGQPDTGRLQQGPPFAVIHGQLGRPRPRPAGPGRAAVPAATVVGAGRRGPAASPREARWPAR